MTNHQNASSVARAVTRGPAHHFFGYYNLTPWDATGRYLLALEVEFCDRAPQAGDVARIGLVDTAEDNAWKPLTETRAWNWQQGCMAQWLPAHPERLIVYNDIIDGQAVAVVRDVFSGDAQTLPRPVYTLSPDGSEALSLDFARVHRLRPGYGYAAAPDHTSRQRCPSDDGIYRMDMRSGENRLILSLRQLTELCPRSSMRRAVHWVNHLEFNTNGSRFVFLHRWQTVMGPTRQFLSRAWRKARRTLSPNCDLPITRVTRMLTAQPDGSDLRILADDEMVSHFDWPDAHHLLVWARLKDRGDHYYLFDVRSGQAEILGRDLLTVDGHCTYSPDRTWVLTDTYPDRETSSRQLILYHPAQDRRIDLGAFYSPPKLTGEIRCDLHPRWNREGTRVCFDSVHEGSRQVYVVDVSEIVGRQPAPLP